MCLRWLYHHMPSVSHTGTHARTHIHTHIYIYIYFGKEWFDVFNYCAVLWCSHIIVYSLMIENGYLRITIPHYHHYAYLSEGIELLKDLSDVFCLECVSKIRSVLSIVLFHAIYEAVWILFTHFTYDDCKKTCAWSYYHHQIGRITHLPLFRDRSWNNNMRCMSSSKWLWRKPCLYAMTCFFLICKFWYPRLHLITREYWLGLGKPSSSNRRQ